MLKVNNIEVDYNRVILVLRGVSLDVADGQIVALLGANGAGKSTTLKAISGLLYTELGRVFRGNIDFDGHRIDTIGPESIARSGVIQIMENRRVLPHLTVEDNLLVGGVYKSQNKECERGNGACLQLLPSAQGHPE